MKHFCTYLILLLVVFSSCCKESKMEKEQKRIDKELAKKDGIYNFTGPDGKQYRYWTISDFEIQALMDQNQGINIDNTTGMKTQPIIVNADATSRIGPQNYSPQLVKEQLNNSSCNQQSNNNCQFARLPTTSPPCSCIRLIATGRFNGLVGAPKCEITGAWIALAARHIVVDNPWLNVNDAMVTGPNGITINQDIENSVRNAISFSGLENADLPSGTYSYNIKLTDELTGQIKTINQPFSLEQNL